MNYAIVDIGGLIVLTGLQYLFWGRRHYNGIVHTYSPDHPAYNGEPNVQEINQSGGVDKKYNQGHESWID